MYLISPSTTFPFCSLFIMNRCSLKLATNECWYNCWWGVGWRGWKCGGERGKFIQTFLALLSIFILGAINYGMAIKTSLLPFFFCLYIFSLHNNNHLVNSCLPLYNFFSFRWGAMAEWEDFRSYLTMILDFHRENSSHKALKMIAEYAKNGDKSKMHR